MAVYHCRGIKKRRLNGSGKVPSFLADIAALYAGAKNPGDTSLPRYTADSGVLGTTDKGPGPIIWDSAPGPGTSGLGLAPEKQVECHEERKVLLSRLAPVCQH